MLENQTHTLPALGFDIIEFSDSFHDIFQKNIGIVEGLQKQGAIIPRGLLKISNEINSILNDFKKKQVFVEQDLPLDFSKCKFKLISFKEECSVSSLCDKFKKIPHNSAPIGLHLATANHLIAFHFAISEWNILHSVLKSIGEFIIAPGTKLMIHKNEVTYSLVLKKNKEYNFDFMRRDYDNYVIGSHFQTLVFES